MSSSLRSLQPSAQATFGAFIRFLARMGVQVIVTSTRRDLDEQAKLYERFKAGLSPYPAAPPGHSTHAAGIAVDMKLTPPVYDWAGRVWEAAGFTWGGRFHDPIHFDLRRRGTA